MTWLMHSSQSASVGISMHEWSTAYRSVGLSSPAVVVPFLQFGILCHNTLPDAGDAMHGYDVVLCMAS